ncbi:hypothetical protein ABZ154_34895 [Streptomyces sp. NPDC006261]|uniref:hypothetical protein n=1 Tax=Streptomyces sp. NPDC006261 TaxID=3156739 RepID=UPI0033AF9D74
MQNIAYEEFSLLPDDRAARRRRRTGLVLGGRRRVRFVDRKLWAGLDGGGGPGQAVWMDDEDAAPGEDNRAVKVALYMETLQARMDPNQYGALAQALHEAFHLLAQGREGTIGSEDDTAEFTPEMHREFATILTMLLTGKIDQQVVEVPSSDGHSGFVLMDPEEADGCCHVVGCVGL